MTRLNDYINKMKEIENGLLYFMENIENIENNFEIFQKLLIDKKIKDDKHDLTSLFHLITKIINNFHRGPSTFDKIEKIILLFKEDIKRYFSNTEIFNIFKSNKRILLFLTESKIMIFDEYIIKTITTVKYENKNYPQYFAPEINFKKIDNKLPENFYENRKIGENNSYICKLIQKDAFNDFDTYVKRSNISVNSKIPPSIYETNNFLIKKQTENENNQPFSLIEYAAFCGSFQIFKYLKENEAQLTQTLLLYAIHGNNFDIIQLLEENIERSNNELIIKCFVESIKCHHNDITNYFRSKYLLNNDENSNKTLVQAMKYYNLSFISNELIGEYSFLYACKYDYYLISDYLLNDQNIDINKITVNLFLNIIQNHIF